MLLVGICVAHAQESSKPREWTSTTGSKVTATLVSSTRKQVTLRTAKGKTIRLKLKQLSEADRKWIAENARGSSGLKSGEPDTERLAAILEKALKEDPTDSERKEAQGIFASLLNGKKESPGNAEWELKFHKIGTPVEERDSILISADLKPKGGGDRLVWAHIVFKGKKPDSYGIEKFKSYPVMRMENRHVFLLAGRTEIRLVADDDDWKDDGKLEGLFKAMDLKAIKKL